MMQTKVATQMAVLALLWSSTLVDQARACRVNSESLKKFSRDRIESLLDVERLRSIYWPDEPLDASSLARAIGINVTSAVTHFQLGTPANVIRHNSTSTSTPATLVPLLHDLFVTCSVDRDRIYALLLNLELNNPFEMIDVRFQIPSSSDPTQNGRSGSFRIHLLQSTFLVNLRQRFKYDECLGIKYVQLAPNVNYNIECVDCNREQQEHLDRIFSKRMIQLDSELDSLLSEKLLLGLQVLSNQQRLELDLFLD